MALLVAAVEPRHPQPTLSLGPEPWRLDNRSTSWMLTTRTTMTASMDRPTRRRLLQDARYAFGWRYGCLVRACAAFWLCLSCEACFSRPLFPRS